MRKKLDKKSFNHTVPRRLLVLRHHERYVNLSMVSATDARQNAPHLPKTNWNTHCHDGAQRTCLHPRTRIIEKLPRSQTGWQLLFWLSALSDTNGNKIVQTNSRAQEIGLCLQTNVSVCGGRHGSSVHKMKLVGLEHDICQSSAFLEKAAKQNGYPLMLTLCEGI